MCLRPMSEPNATVGGQGGERRDPLPLSVGRTERRRRWKGENPKPEPRPPMVDCVTDLAQGKVTLDRFCCQHGATKDEVILALAQVVVRQAHDIESMAHALEVKDGQIDIRGERMRRPEAHERATRAAYRETAGGCLLLGAGYDSAGRRNTGTRPDEAQVALGADHPREAVHSAAPEDRKGGR
jgi:hypothetical protein